MQAATNYSDRYAAMSESELADLVLGDLNCLNDEARSAFQAELLKRGLTLAKLQEQYPPELASNVDRGESRGSVLQEFGFLGVPVGLVLALVLYFVLADKPFGIQVAVLVGYTVYVFFFLFSNVRSSKGYDLRQKAVRQTIPHLSAIHAAFLAIVFISLTIALWVATFSPTILDRGERQKEWKLV